MLPLLILIPIVFAKDSSVDKNFTIKRIDSCPEEGYYFRRELIPNTIVPGPCYLCFCQNDGTAVCWRRDNRRCDVEIYHYHHIGKRDSRAKRGLGDIFLRNAANKIFSKKMPKQCKPFESSFSDGCPPADWCTGCTVCDCTASGHWDCRVLSYCSSQTSNKSEQSPRKGPRKRTVIRRLGKINNKLKIKDKPTQESINKIINKPDSRLQKRDHENNYKQVRNMKIIQKRNQFTRNVVKFLPKKTTTPSKDPTKQILLPTSPKLAQTAVRKIMAAVRNMMRKDLEKGNSSRILKAIDKSRVANLNNINTDDKQNTKRNRNIKRKYIGQKNLARNKRDIKQDTDIFVEVNTTTNLPKENTTTPVTTIVDSNYYRYLNVNTTVLITTNQPMISIFTKDFNLTIKEMLNTTTEKNAQFIINVTEKVGREIKPDNRMVYRIDKIPDANDLKCKKWTQIKLLKDKSKRFKNELLKSKKFDNIFGDKKIKTVELSNDKNNNDYFKHQLQKIGGLKKYNLRKLINTSKIKKYENLDASNIVYLNNKITKLQKYVKNFFKDLDTNNTNRVNRKLKHFNVFKYLSKFFNKIFFNRRKNFKYDINSLENNHILKTLCENFGPCQIPKKRKHLLQIKLKSINLETNKIFKIINIIKGLLHLVEIPVNKNEDFKGPKSNINNDLKKLNYILKNTFTNEFNEKHLSETQLIQIEYIKMNAKEFVKSIAKLATLLNRTIAILTEKENKGSRGVPIQNKTNKDEAFVYIKSLLIKYDIIHNTFLRQMYDVLANFEAKSNQQKHITNNFKEDTSSINNFSNNIITNLRKLTHLAKTLNSRRYKRQVSADEDALEYLLILMEHLLKQNYPLDTAPVNDGIDLLLESIKHSPDKSIKKKVLNNPTLRKNINMTNKQPKVDELTTENISNSHFKHEDSKLETNITSKLDDPKFTEELEEERDYEDKYINKKSMDTSTAPVNYRRKFDATTFKIEEETISDKQNKVIDTFEANNTTFDKIQEKYGGADDSKKYEIYNADLEEDDEETDKTTESITEVVTQGIKIRNTKDESVSKIAHKPLKLDWVHKESKGYKEYKSLSHSESNTTPNTKVITTHKLLEDNISAISKEVKREERRKKSTISMEEVMHKKQMDLLNSLDYVTENTNVEDNESKEKVEDKYSVDTLPDYF